MQQWDGEPRPPALTAIYHHVSWTDKALSQFLHVMYNRCMEVIYNEFKEKLNGLWCPERSNWPTGTTDKWHLTDSDVKFRLRVWSFPSFSYLLFPPRSVSSLRAAELNDGVFCPSVPANQTKAFSASAAAAAPSLCVTLILEKTTPSSSAQGTVRLWISSSLLDLSRVFFFFFYYTCFAGAVASCNSSRNAVPTRLSDARTLGQVSRLVSAGRENRYERKDYPSEISAGCISISWGVSSPALLIIFHLQWHEVCPSHFP